MSRNRRSPSGFTLLEVMVATLIIAMLALALHRFLATHLTAMRVMTDIDSEREALEAVTRLVEGQLRDLPTDQPEALTGRPFKFQGLSNDELKWRSIAGAGLVTTAAVGEFVVTLTVQPVSERSTETELGLRRQLVDPNQIEATDDFSRGAGKNKYNWLPLIRPMAALEVRYYDAKLAAWTDAWTDAQRRPELVRIRLWKHPTDAPVEAVLSVPSALMQN